MNCIRIKSMIILFILIKFTNAFALYPSERSLKASLGYGIHMGKNTDGVGVVYSLAYQKEIWNERFSLNPNISFGQYNSKFLPLGARDQYFNSTNLGLNLFFDLSKSEAFSLFLACGGLVNYTSGMLGEGGDPEAFPENLQAEYVSDFHVGAVLGAGFRINSLSKRTSLNIMPFNIHVGNQGFAELTPKIEIEIKL